MSPQERRSTDKVLRIDCPEARKWLHRYVEGEVEPVVGALVKAHVTGCVDCAALCAELEQEKLWVIEEALVTPRFSESFRGHVIDTLRAEQKVARRVHWRDVFFSLSGVAAAALVLGLAYLQVGGSPVAIDAGMARAIPESVPASGVDAPLKVELAGDNLALHDLAPERALRNIPYRYIRVHGTYPPDLELHVGEVVSAALKLGSSRGQSSLRGYENPCSPDPNRDGRMDLNDVAYSCQALLTGTRPQVIEEGEASSRDPECEDICLKV